MLLVHLVGCLGYCIRDARSHKHQSAIVCCGRLLCAFASAVAPTVDTFLYHYRNEQRCWQQREQQSYADFPPGRPLVTQATEAHHPAHIGRGEGDETVQQGRSALRITYVGTGT